MVIYLITNEINGKMYVGQTTRTIKKRWKGHLDNAKSGHQNHLYRAIRKYGKEAFSIKPLSECSDLEQLNNLERIWILLLNTHSSQNGYNMTYGGEGLVATDEVRAKISRAMKGRKLSEAECVRIGDMHRGKPKPLAQRQKMAAHWTCDRKQEQAAVARRVNEIENKKLGDYTCPDCGKEFEQVTKGVYGGHRKACLHWKRVAATLEKEMGQTLDKILEGA